MDTPTAIEVIGQRSADFAVLRPIESQLGVLSAVMSLTYCDRTDNTALRFDIDGADVLGRLTWWSDGSIFVEALRISDEAVLLRQHVAGATAADTSSVLLSLAQLVVDVPSNNSFKPTPLRGSAQPKS